MADNNWYVVTGGPSTGKSTLLAELQKRGYKTIPEAARTLIDEALKKGKTVAELRADERHFQEEVIKLKDDIESSLDRSAVTFFDRGMHDTIAYMQHYGFELDKWTQNLMSKSVYKKIFLLEQLPYYTENYARTESEDFRSHIHDLLHQAYTAYDMQPVTVPVASPEERADLVLKHVQEDTP